MNEVEFLPGYDFMLVAVHQPDGVTILREMDLESFDRLKQACEREA